MRQHSRHDELANKILVFLNDNYNTAFTAQELVEDRHIYSSKPSVQKSLSALLREGLIKVKSKGNEIGYQAVIFQDTNAEDL